jgi:hypothetical protein
MISFELAQELKSAGFSQSTAPYAIYALTDHLRVRREHALQMWYGSRAKEGVALQLNEEAVYAPTLSELAIACGKPLQLGCDESGNWKASRPLDERLIGEGETAEEALGRLWLKMAQST